MASGPGVDKPRKEDHPNRQVSRDRHEERRLQTGTPLTPQQQDWFDAYTKEKK